MNGLDIDGKCVACGTTGRPIKSRRLCQACYGRNQKAGTLGRYSSPVAEAAAAAKLAAEQGVPVPVAVRREAIEQSLARTGSVLATMQATGASYERVQAARHHIDEVHAEPEVRDRAKVAA